VGELFSRGHAVRQSPQSDASSRGWVDAKCTPQPIQCLLQPVALSGARERIRKKAYIRSEFPYGAFDAGMSEARKHEWDIHKVRGGHDVMIDAPKQLAEILDGLA
jgi:hypothetical protein